MEYEAKHRRKNKTGFELSAVLGELCLMIIKD